jgi:K+-transporting ATPase ATPase A chain
VNTLSILKILLYFGILTALVKPLGLFMARVYQGKVRFLRPVERIIYAICGTREDQEMNWKVYAVAVLMFNLVGVLVVYGCMRLQASLPFNPQKMANISPDLSFNTAISFVTNTNWQSYTGEASLSYLTQMLALTVQNFVSAATGMAVMVALIRGISRKTTQDIGNFWVDLVRSTIYILLPLSFVLAMVLVSQGVVQTFSEYRNVALVEPMAVDTPRVDTSGNPVNDAQGKQIVDHTVVTEQTLALGPAASQIAIKQLGTNGGGFFGQNSAHPYENPTAISNFLEMLSILLIPAALCFTFGEMIGDRRQGWAILAAMTIILIPLTFLCASSEQAPNPTLSSLNLNWSGGNMEGKEARFGVADSAIWACATTAASNGSVNSMHDSFSPLGGLIPMWLMELGEVIYGGVGCGLYGMLMFAIIAVFVAGLMVGRTPEYLGKKIESFEMKMASIFILIPPAVTKIGAAIAVCLKPCTDAVSNPGPHAFSEILYWASSVGNNNGSAFAGLSTNNVQYNIIGATLMFLSRFWLIVPCLAIAGSLASKKHIPPSPGTLPTHTPLFVTMLIGVVLLVGALTFFPALALGPIVEHLQ